MVKLKLKVRRISKILDDKYVFLGTFIVAFFTFLSFVAPYLAPYGPFEFSEELSQPPSFAFPLGTDQLGGDIMSQIVWGSQVSLMFGLGAAGISLVVGILLGGIAGFFGGAVDDLISRFIEAFLMIPRLFLIILMVVLFKSSIFILLLIVGLTIWPTNARLMRAQVLTLKVRGFVQAAKVSGAGNFRILFRHILPNGIYPVLANSTVQMAHAIITEANLSFLGLGDPNVVSWGKILLKAQRNLSAWWMLLFPGIAIMCLVFGFHLLGDGLNRTLNPRLQEVVEQ